jgi:hypothetical protein
MAPTPKNYCKMSIRNLVNTNTEMLFTILLTMAFSTGVPHNEETISFKFKYCC